MTYWYQHFLYKKGAHGFVYVWHNSEWVRSGVTWAEIEKHGDLVSQDEAEAS